MFLYDMSGTSLSSYIMLPFCPMCQRKAVPQYQALSGTVIKRTWVVHVIVLNHLYMHVPPVMIGLHPWLIKFCCSRMPRLCDITIPERRMGGKGKYNGFRMMDTQARWPR